MALFAAIWLLHRPLQVHSCPQRGARIAHRLLEWTLYAWLVVLVCQLYGLLTTARRPSEPKIYVEPQELDATARNREAMRKFETCINTNDLALGEELIAADAAFATPVSPTPLYGAKGYLSVVELMRQSFPDVQWKLEAMVAATGIAGILQGIGALPEK